MHQHEIVDADVVIVGGGPAGLATAIHLADLIEKHNGKVAKKETKDKSLKPNIFLVDKGSTIGSHTLSGAVVNPDAFLELLPGVSHRDIPFEELVEKDEVYYFTKNRAMKLPLHPPGMDNEGNYVISLGKIVRWLSGIAEKKGIQVFPGFTGDKLLYKNGSVAGVRTADSGIDKRGKKRKNYQPGTDVVSKLTILAEGSRGHLSSELIAQAGLDKGKNPQIYALGIKELWEVPEENFEPGQIMHVLGYPLSGEEFGGGFVYGMSPHETRPALQVAVGLVAGLDYRDPTFDPHAAFQLFKRHPKIEKILAGGKLLCYGAKTIPEGGFFSLPRLCHDGALLVGDCAGFVTLPALKGVHLAIRSGMLAAKTAYEALRQNNFSKKQLALYESLFEKSAIHRELYPSRNFRQGFRNNLFKGMGHFGMQLLTGGRGLSSSGRIEVEEDFKSYGALASFNGHTFQKRFEHELAFDNKATFDKATNVFHSGTHHDEDQPCHCVFKDEGLLKESIEKFGAPSQYYCPGNVFELVTDSKTGKKDMRQSPSNCLHCKTCDIKEPFGNVQWTPPLPGDGPEYENM